MADRNELSQSTAASTLLPSKVDPTSARFEANMRFMADLVSQIRNEEEKIREGGGAKAIESQHTKGRLDRARTDPVAGRSEHLLRTRKLRGIMACTKSGAAHLPQA